MTIPVTDTSREAPRSGYSADAWRIIAARGLRQFAYGMLGVTLAALFSGANLLSVARSKQATIWRCGGSFAVSPCRRSSLQGELAMKLA